MGARQIAGDPLVLFFLIGTGLFFIYDPLGPELLSGDGSQPVTLSAAGRAVLISEFETLTGRTATPEDERALVQDYYRDELLFREAMASEIYRNDGELRSALIERMRQQVSGELADPDPRTLVNFYADNMERYYSEATISFEQRFFREAPVHPVEVLAAIRAGQPIQDDIPWQGPQFPHYGESMIRGLFGGSLLGVLKTLPLDAWHGPYESARGWHYLRVSERREAVLLAFTQVRDQVRVDVQAAEIDRRIAAFVDERRDRYPLLYTAQ